MGLERHIHFPGDITPTWEAIHGALPRVGESPVLRMIDGLPAFPDEIPDTGWKELRIATSAGMVTIRRRPGMLSCVVWGNADPALDVAWSKVVWACAEAGNGMIETPAGSISADQFRQVAQLFSE
jgi:hypothetical protein